ncbi:Uncharacterized protein BM_BM1670 [Brugia malayi]|uniref:Bm1670, isoform b n=1 Tax=Brugia malayi TaxID=6279 RepID=A0A0H5S5C4_BRUMA|nr:Uncharacterized protein BM_BM1670 [Brugia malayi]CRZ23819.1 Bm1670, isoform b [Brugia malayi]VIO86960.1 Uncharacterized protein BM_BM1670 [Brugia malayi]
MSENEQKMKTKEMSRNMMDSDQKAVDSTTAPGKSISTGILMGLDKAFQNKDLSGITEQQYQYYNRRCEEQKQQRHQHLQHRRINDFTGSLEDELSAAVIGIGDSETILQAIESVVIEYPFAVYDSGPSTFNSPKQSIMELKQDFKVNDLRRISQETTSQLNLYKCSYFSDVKLSLESRPLADELRECGIINKVEPPSMPRPDFLPDRIFKVVFLGDSAVGKTCFLSRFCHNRFKLLFNATIGVDFTVKTIRLCNRVVAVQLWDTAGQERFRSITEQYFRKADGIILMYDVTSERSFLNVRNWINSMKAGVDESCVMCLVGNKIDLFANDQARVLTYKYGKKLAEEFGMLFFETSAFNGFGVNDCMRAVAMKLQEREDQQMVDILKLDMSLQKKQKSWCCI